MDVKGMDQMLSALRETAAKAGAQVAESRNPTQGSVDFAQILKNSIDKVNQTQQQAENMAVNFAAGESTENLHDVMISLQKANVSFQQMVQVRNKLVTAYNDIMNMQI